jgi:putative transposase
VCAFHAPGPVDPFRDCLQTVNPVEPSSSADTAEISPAILVQEADEAGPQGTQPGSHRRRRRHERAESDLGCPRIAQQITQAFGIPINKDVVRRILAARHQPKPNSAGPSWLTVLGHAKDSLWSLDLFRCESAVLHTHWVLVVMDQCTRRIVGFGVHRGVVDGVALCQMFNRATRRQSAPTYLSSDHDPLYRFHQWQANLRILDVEAIKTVPYVPLSHPFVERLIGTIRRECLDRTLFWTAADLEVKLHEFQRYFNGHRTHAGLGGRTPEPCTGEDSAQASVSKYRWRPHCRGLYQTPIAA